MKKQIFRGALIAALLSTTAIAAGTAILAPVAAQAADKVGKAVGVPLTEAQKSMAAGDYPAALAAAKLAQAVPDQNPYETYTINKFLSIIYINTKDYPDADVAVEAAADSDAMPDEDKPQIYHNAVVLAAQTKHDQKTVVYAQKLEAVKGLDDATMAMAAVAYYNLKDAANAKKYAQMSVDAAKAAGKQPDPNALAIVMNSEAKSNPGAVLKMMEDLVVASNNPDDWNRIVNNAFGSKGLTNADALNLYRILFFLSAMQSADDYNYMGALAEGQRNSYEAVKVFDAGVAAGKITSADANSKLGKGRSEAASDEKIINTAITAARASKKGEDAMQVAQDLWGYGRYADVEALAGDALAKGGAKDPGEANVLIGIAQVAQGKYDQGQATLAKVTGSEGRLRTAHLWTLVAQAKQKSGGAAAH